MSSRGTYIIVASNSLWEAIVRQQRPPQRETFSSSFTNPQFAEAALKRRHKSIKATGVTRSSVLRVRFGQKYRFVKQFKTDVGKLHSRKYEIWEVL